MTNEGEFHGEGRMTHANGDIYQGRYEHGRANGFGVLIDVEGSVYEG